MTLRKVPNPRPTPAQPKNGAPNPMPNLVPNPRPTMPNPRPTSGAQPSPPKGGDYCVPPLGVRHKPMLVPDRIEALAARVLRLMVSHSNPERFFEERSEIAWELRKLAKAAQR